MVQVVINECLYKINENNLFHLKFTDCNGLKDRRIIFRLWGCMLQGTAVFDFANTGYEVYGNCNAPRAVVLSALIYCLRSMVGHDIPLNQVSTVLFRENFHLHCLSLFPSISFLSVYLVFIHAYFLHCSIGHLC